jgi:hypothetical protein
MVITSYIYLIQDGKDIGTNIFKIGKTKQGIDNIIKLKRLHGYSKGTIQYNTWLVSYTILDDLEIKIKTYFKNKYVLVRGYEWFEGNVKEMKKDIDIIIENYDTENYILNEPITNHTNIEKCLWRNNINYMSYEFIDNFLLIVYSIQLKKRHLDFLGKP